MMARTTADVLLERLADWGVDTVCRPPPDRLRQVRRGRRGHGVPLRETGRSRPAVAAAFASKKPAIIEAVVDRFEPPMPARATAKQALHFAESLARDEPNRVKIATTIYPDKVIEFLR